MLLTRRGWAIIAIAVAAGALSVKAHAPVLLSLSFLALASLAVSVVVLLRLDGGLAVDREVPAEVFAGDAIRMVMRLTNTGAVKSLFFLTDRPRLRGAESVMSAPVDVLKSRERRELVWNIPAPRRGVLRFQHLTVESRAPFGLLERSTKLAVPGSTAILPRPGRMFDWEAPGGRRHSGTGVESLDRSGGTQEFYAVREYRPEDPLKHVHWKLTARAGKLMVREFQTTSSLEVEVLPNASRGDYRGPAAEAMFEGAVALAATVCAELLRRGYFVRLWSAGRTIRASSLEAGPMHLKRLLVELAGLEADRDEPFADALGHMAGGFTPRAAVVVLTPYHVLPDLAPAVSGLADRLFSPQLMVLEPPAGMTGAGVFAPEDALLGAIAGARAPGYRFRADDDFSLVRMRDHEARRVGFRGRATEMPEALRQGRWGPEPGTPAP